MFNNGKLINRIPGSRLLISSLPGLALRTHVESLGMPRDVNKHSQSLPGKLDIKRHSPSILSIYFVNRQEWVIIIIVSMMTVMLLNYFLAI